MRSLNIDMEKYKNYEFFVRDNQLKGLPKKTEYCAKCLMSNQRPRNEFKDGICNACIYHEHKQKIDWAKREEELKTLCDKHRNHFGGFDCIVPSSGGKDSIRVVHELKTNYKMHPLMVTFAPSLYTDIGRQNYESLIHSGFNGLVFWADGYLHRKLCRAALELVGDNFLPFIYGQKALAFRVAVMYGIPLIFYGENGEAEYGGSLKNWDKSHESSDDWKELYMKGVGIDVLVQEGHKMGIFTPEEVLENDFSMYRMPPLAKVRELDAKMYWFSYFKYWSSRDNVLYAMGKTGFMPSPERTEGSYTRHFSLDDKTDGIHYYMSLVKFGYGRARREASADIRAGFLTKEEAQENIDKYDFEFPNKYFQECLDYFGMTEGDFKRVVDKFKGENFK